MPTDLTGSKFAAKQSAVRQHNSTAVEPSLLEEPVERGREDCVRLIIHPREPIITAGVRVDFHDAHARLPNLPDEAIKHIR